MSVIDYAFKFLEQYEFLTEAEKEYYQKRLVSLDNNLFYGIDTEEEVIKKVYDLMFQAETLNDERKGI